MKMRMWIAIGIVILLVIIIVPVGTFSPFVGLASIISPRNMLTYYSGAFQIIVISSFGGPPVI